MNLTEPTTIPDSDDECRVYFHDRARQSGFSNLFDWLILRHDPDDLEGFLIASHAHVIELIHEISADQAALDVNTQLFRDHAREVGLDKLMQLFLHDLRPDCAEGELYAAETYISELIEQVARTDGNGTA
jgi:hypothetical protein